METSPQSTQKNSQTLNSSLEDSPVNLSLLRETEADSATPEAHSFLTSLGLLLLKNRRVFSLRTSEDSSATTKEGHSKQSSPRLMNWGMTRNGACLTGQISAVGKDHACLSMLHTGTTKLMLGKGPSKPYRFTLASARGHELQLVPYRKLGEVPSELYEHLQSFPIGWTAGKLSTVRKAKLGNAVQPNVVRAIMSKILTPTPITKDNLK